MIISYNDIEPHVEPILLASKSWKYNREYFKLAREDIGIKNKEGNYDIGSVVWGLVLNENYSIRDITKEIVRKNLLIPNNKDYKYIPARCYQYYASMIRELEFWKNVSKHANIVKDMELDLQGKDFIIKEPISGSIAIKHIGKTTNLYNFRKNNKENENTYILWSSNKRRLGDIDLVLQEEIDKFISDMENT